MKIFVCLPSLNEAGTIGNITRIVDRGLRSVPGIIEALIVNADSNSSDGTREVFSQQDTFYPKFSFVSAGDPGKGRNLLEFAKLAVREKADFCITIDTDIISATDSWVSQLLNPLILGEADYVTPLYERSRFEGSSTNHFAYPTIYGFTGWRIRQPIAGDFAFNSKFLTILLNKKPSAAVYGYGIDISLSLIAATSSLRIRQVRLGKKIHGPSFRKLERMFPQIAASALTVLRQTDIRRDIGQSKTEVVNILEEKVFPHRVVAVEMLERARNVLINLRQEECVWLQESTRAEVIGFVLETQIQSPSEQEKMWMNVLADWFEFGLKDYEVDALQMGLELLPFFVVRAVQFWFMSEALTAEETEQAINNQAEALRHRLHAFLDPAA